MKNSPILTFVLLLFFSFTSCDSTNYKAELDNHFGVWNSVVRSMEILVNRYDEVETRDAIKELGHFAATESKALEKREKKLSGQLELSGNEDVKKINRGLLEYVQENHAIAVKYEELSESVGSLTDAEMQAKIAEIDTLLESMNAKGNELIALQDEYGKKHNITIESH